MKWEGTKWMKRGEDYDNLKEKITNRLIEHLYEHLPHLKGKIDTYELSSPLTTKNFVNYEKVSYMESTILHQGLIKNF